MHDVWGAEHKAFGREGPCSEEHSSRSNDVLRKQLDTGEDNRIWDRAAYLHRRTPLAFILS